VAAAIAAKHRAPQGISLAARNRAVGCFLQDCAQRFLVFPLERAIIDSAVSLTQRYRLRGYDAVQLAAGLAANDDMVTAGRPPLVLVAADSDLVLAARAEGLTTDNPLDYTHLDPSP
jgi:uncharacterized protein